MNMDKLNEVVEILKIKKENEDFLSNYFDDKKANFFRIVLEVAKKLKESNIAEPINLKNTFFIKGINYIKTHINFQKDVVSISFLPEYCSKTERKYIYSNLTNSFSLHSLSPIKENELFIYFIFKLKKLLKCEKDADVYKEPNLVEKIINLESEIFYSDEEIFEIIVNALIEN